MTATLAAPTGLVVSGAGVLAVISNRSAGTVSTVGAATGAGFNARVSTSTGAAVATGAGAGANTGGGSGLELATEANTGATMPGGGWADTRTGLIYVDTPGTVIEDWHVTGQIRVRAANVTVRNCHVVANYSNQAGIWGFFAGGYTPTGLIVEDCTVVGVEADTPASAGVVGYLECRRCNISNCADGLKGSDQAGEVTEQNLIHHLRVGWTGTPHTLGVNNTHSDGMQWQAADGAVVRFNRVHGPFYDGGGPNQPADVTAEVIESSINGGIFFKGDSGPNTDVDVHDNEVFGFGSNLIFYDTTSRPCTGDAYDNVLGVGDSGGFALFGPISLAGSPATGVVCRTNVDQVGAPIDDEN